MEPAEPNIEAKWKTKHVWIGSGKIERARQRHPIKEPKNKEIVGLNVLL